MTHAEENVPSRSWWRWSLWVVDLWMPWRCVHSSHQGAPPCHVGSLLMSGCHRRQSTLVVALSASCLCQSTRSALPIPVKNGKSHKKGKGWTAPKIRNILTMSLLSHTLCSLGSVLCEIKPTLNNKQVQSEINWWQKDWPRRWLNVEPLQRYPQFSLVRSNIFWRKTKILWNENVTAIVLSEMQVFITLNGPHRGVMMLWLTIQSFPSVLTQVMSRRPGGHTRVPFGMVQFHMRLSTRSLYGKATMRNSRFSSSLAISASHLKTNKTNVQEPDILPSCMIHLNLADKTKTKIVLRAGMISKHTNHSSLVGEIYICSLLNNMMRSITHHPLSLFYDCTRKAVLLTWLPPVHRTNWCQSNCVCCWGLVSDHTRSYLLLLQKY